MLSLLLLLLLFLLLFLSIFVTNFHLTILRLSFCKRLVIFKHFIPFTSSLENEPIKLLSSYTQLIIMSRRSLTFLSKIII